MTTKDGIYRAALIGCGRKGHGHARGYAGNPRTEVVAAADPDEDNLRIFLEHFPVPGYSDYRELLAKEEIDIAAPILPVRPNPGVVIDCAEAGVKAVYCEKPMAASLEEADAMVEACESRGIAFASGDAYRNMPQHWKVKRLIDSGGLGELCSINLYQSTNEISGGGCQGLSVLRLFADDADVAWLTGWCLGDPFSDDDQCMGGAIRFANGVDAFIHTRRSPMEGIEVVCSEGVYHSNWMSGHLWRGDPHGKLVEEEDFFTEFGDPEDWIYPSGTRQRGGIQSIVESLDQGIEPRCSGQNMRKVLEIAIGLRQSHREGHAPVRFPIQDRSLKIVPAMSRYLNKKETFGEERYAEQIQSAAGRPSAAPRRRGGDGVTSDSFLASLYTYPWDLADDGLDLALDRIADLAACGEVLLTPCYHRSEYYLPHNPRRPVYYGENGAVYFSPDMSRYEGTRISPRVSREVTDPAWFDRMVEAIRKRGLGFSAWMVYTFQNHLSERYPEFARHDAFGTPHVGALSTAPRDVRDYFTALTAEVLDRFGPDAVWVESLGRRGFSMPGKRRAQMPERCRWLLSLCFNPASMAFADAAGLEAEALRRDLVEWMRPRLSAGADPDADEPATPAWIEEAFDGRLQRYMEISRRQTTDLWIEVVELIRGRGVRVQADLASPERALTNDLDPVVNRHVDRLSYSLREGEEPRQRIRELEGMIADGGKVFVSPAGDLREAEPIRQQLAAARGGGAGGATFYNYGLLTLEQLGNIGRAVRSM